MQIFRENSVEEEENKKYVLRLRNGFILVKSNEGKQEGKRQL